MLPCVIQLNRKTVTAVVCLAVLLAAGCSSTSGNIPVTGPTLSSLGTQVATNLAPVIPSVQTQAVTVLPGIQTQVTTVVPGIKTAVAPAINGLGTTVATVVPGAATQVGTAVTGNVINVTVSDTSLEIPSNAKPGILTFVVTNKGTVAHSLAIQGPGVTSQLPQDLQPGQSGTLVVTLQKGTYTVFSPTAGDKSKGLSQQLAVQP